MKYAERIREGAVYIASSDVRLTNDDLVMEWAHALSADYRYIYLTPAKRRNYLLKRIVYDAVAQEYGSEPKTVQIALSFQRYLQTKEMILEDELLAGAYQFSDHIYTHPFDEQDEFENFEEGAQAIGLEYPAEDCAVFLDYVRCGFCTKNPSGHVIPDYPRLLKLGYGGILAKIECELTRQLDSAFLRAAKITVEAAQSYILRNADLYSAKAQQTTNKAARRRLERTAEACRWLSVQPPRTFFEAVQLIAITHELAIIEQLSGSISFGRFDAYVLPYYQADMQRGKLDEEQAYEVVYTFLDKIGRNRLAYQNMTLGGYNEAGDGFLPADVTRLCLRASTALHKDEPMLTFRWNRYMPDSLWDDVLTSIRSGSGFPALFNDDVVIAAKKSVGLSDEDALRYGMIGCVEICAPGKEFSHAEGLRINWAKMLEIALSGGKDTVSGICFGLKNPRPLSSFESYEAFFEWFMEEFFAIFGRMLHVLDCCEAYYPHQWSLPFMSSLMTGCIEKGMDVTAGGTLYNNTAINNNSMANLADSLQAIRRFVFEEKRFTLDELASMLQANFEGHEQLRTQMMHAIRRYGNGFDDSEAIMRTVSDRLHAFVGNRRNCRNGHYQMGYYSVWAQTTFGALTGALPDGRLSGTHLANSMAPVQGSEKNGPTAIASSANCLNHATFGNGMVLDYKFAPAFFDTPAHCAAFRALIEGYFALGGMEMQFNVVSRETLLDAQAHPENHENLIVRVSGYSAFFNDLSKDIQDEIIQRTEFR